MVGVLYCAPALRALLASGRICVFTIACLFRLVIFIVLIVLTIVPSGPERRRSKRGAQKQSNAYAFSGSCNHSSCPWATLAVAETVAHLPLAFGAVAFGAAVVFAADAAAAVLAFQVWLAPLLPDAARLTLASKWQPDFVLVSNRKYTARPSRIAIKLKNYVPFYTSIDEESPSSSKFAKAFRECAVAEAQQLMRRFDHLSKPIKPTDIIIDDAVAMRITPHLLHFRASLHDGSPYSLKQPPPSTDAPIPLCTHQQGLECGCILPLMYRRLSAFCSAENTKGDFSTAPKVHSYLSEVVLSILITENEMQPVISIVASPYKKLTYMDRVRGGSVLGCRCDIYEHVLRAAMFPYIILNALCQRRETWDPAAKLQPWHDYRDTNLYQVLISRVKGGLKPKSSILTYRRLHQSFFEMPETWSLMPFKLKKVNLPPVRISSVDAEDSSRVELGTMPFSSFAGSNKARRAEMKWVNSKFQGDSTAKLLHDKGLPMEIIDIIVALAEEDTWKFAVPDDPLNMRNRPVLLKYLRRCWDIILLCTLMFDQQSVQRSLEREVFGENSYTGTLNDGE
ncbi:hypothetical protein PWT90_08555 [Aphanocladium album]|nr:hypothetical protein PWT90_08555 [Aphanocladium album]